jgi:hypothetical protein
MLDSTALGTRPLILPALTTLFAYCASIALSPTFPVS